MYKFIIPIAPKTKKNHQRIVKCGNIHKIIQSKEYLKYEKQCERYLNPINIDYPVNIKSVFYMPTKRRVDLTNLLSACHDILVKYKVLADDNYHIAYSVNGSYVSYDKLAPRTEIEITKIGDY